MSPQIENCYIDRLLKKDLESALAFVVKRNAHPHLLQTTDFEKLTPYLAQTSTPFSIESLRHTISSSAIAETEKDELLHLLAQEKESLKSTSAPLEIGSRDPKALVDYAIEIARIDPLKVLLEIENLKIRSASDRSKIAEVLAEKILRNHPQLSQNAKENLQIFLNEVLALRLENKKTALMKKICKASTADLELLFKDLPLNQEKKKAKSCYVVCVFARFIRQSPDKAFEQKLAKNAKILRDNIHTQAAIQYLETVSSLNRFFKAQHIDNMISQLVYENESIAERIPLLLTILQLNSAEFKLHGPLSLEELKFLPKKYAPELFRLDEEKSSKILDYFEKSRSPLAILYFMTKINNLNQEPLRNQVLASAEEFLQTIANGTYDTWRYENSPHIQEMLAIGAMSEELLDSWKAPHSQISLNDKLQIDLSSDPTDFLLTGDECGGCQKLTLEPYDISAILGLMDGAFKMVVVRDKETGKMISRAFVRWMLDQETNKPVLLLEPTYTLNTSHSYREEILQYIESYTNHVGVDLVVSPHFSNSYGVKGRSRKYGNEIHSLGSTAPLVFSDTYGYENGSGGTKTDGNYSLKDVLKVDPALDESLAKKL
ncbi:MAG: hypothetical protein FJZ56_07550 [Chlamydiae bacterium]|nr:hypothetical protein [Chlamydiota bacterium]